MADPKVAVVSATVKTSSRIDVIISIAPDADPSLYDVSVTNVFGNDRKKGIGTEIFEVKMTGQIVNPNAAFTYYDLTPGGTGGSVLGDGRNADGSSRVAGSDESVYEHGQCGVTASIFENKAGDATMDPVGSDGKDRHCQFNQAKTTRTLTVQYGAPLGGASVPAATGALVTNVREVLALNVGESGERLFTLLMRGTSTCERVRWDANVVAHDYGGQQRSGHASRPE